MWSTGARTAPTIVDGSRRCMTNRLYSDMASTWAALSDPHRRAVMAMLLERPRAVGSSWRGSA